MTTDPTQIQELIERELEEMFDGGGFSARDMARDLAPLIAAEVRKAQAGAWDEAERATHHWFNDPFTPDMPDNPYREQETGHDG